MNLLYGLDLTREAHKQMFVKLEYFLPKFYLPGNAVTAEHMTYVDVSIHLEDVVPKKCRYHVLPAIS